MHFFFKTLRQIKMSSKYLAYIFVFGFSTIPDTLHAKQRALILTDISPSDQEPDDIESMIRLLLYSNEIDIEGLIATSSCWRSKDPRHPDLISDIVNAYGKVRSNLLTHSSGYPEVNKLLDVIKDGNDNGMAATGNGKSSPGSNHIIKTGTNNDQRPLWICIWGGAATLAQALIDAKGSLSTSELDRFVKKLRIYDLSGQDDAGAWICHTFPDIFYIRSQFQWRGFSTRIDGLWTESRGSDESLVTPAWFKENIIQNHGSFGAIFPSAKYLYEGDTPTFLNLIDNGLTDPFFIEFGGWGGRFMQDKQAQVRTGSDNTTFQETSYDPYKMFTDAKDTWRNNTKEYSNIYCALFRWRSACQNDFAARMDWCISSYANANHPPVAVVNNDTTKEVLYFKSVPGTKIVLNASSSTDPDNDSLHFTWWVYSEPGTYKGSVKLMDSTSMNTSVTIPSGCIEKSFHVILTLTDNGTPPLSSYRRIVVTGIDTVTPIKDTSLRLHINNALKSEYSSILLYSIDGRLARSTVNILSMEQTFNSHHQNLASGFYVNPTFNEMIIPK
jgi:hypothetical protein